MAKKKTTVSNNSFGKKLQTSFKKYWFLWVIGIGLIGFFGVYKPVVVYLEGQRFLKAEQEIEKVAEQIQAKVGPADQVKKDNHCSYASRKFDRGPLSCAVGVNLLYENRDSTQSSALMKDISVLFGSEINNYLNQDNVDHFIPASQDSDQRFAQDLPIAVRDCSIGYAYPAGSESLELFQSTHKENLSLTLSCSDPAIAEHFRVIN